MTTQFMRLTLNNLPMADRDKLRMAKPLLSLSPNEARATLWKAGIIAPWYLRPSQLDLYSMLRSSRFPFVESARQFGKTTTVLTYVEEELRRNPGWICRWALPEKEQAKKIFDPVIEMLEESCPEHLKFKFKHDGTYYEAPNGSRIYLYGVDKDKGKSLRGPFAHIIIGDEFGFWEYPNIIPKILLPQLQSTRGQLILASTPSEDLAHPYYFRKELAISENRFIQKVIYDNEDLKPHEIEEICKEAGGPNSPDWLREYLCQPVTDPKKLIVKEYRDEAWTIPDNTPYPSHFDCYVAIDSGVDDNTAILFLYYDFLNDTVVFDDEIVLRGESTGKIVELVTQREKVVWGEKEVYRRVYDTTKQGILDIRTDYKFTAWIPIKHDKHAAIHQFRTRGGLGKIKIKERCKITRHQLKVGIWRDERQSDFQRSEELGHLDCIAAAIYGNRSIDTTRNPYPQKVFNPFESMLPVSHSQEATEEMQLANLLRPFTARK